jgi:23S rRNA pseudouridine1911/1915/1917 synthase
VVGSLAFTAAEEEVGERIDVVLARRAGVTRTLAQRALKTGSVSVRGTVVRASYRLEPGDAVEALIPEPQLARPEPESIALRVVYSDPRVLVVSKPAGMVTHPAAGHRTGTLVNALLALDQPLSNADSTRPGIVHRLDKDTSGLLLVARDDATQAHLVDALRAHRVGRRYLALVKGAMQAASGTIDAPIGRHPGARHKMAVVLGGRPAVTHYRELSASGDVTLLEVSLETGRTHQIRVHLAHLGRPVLGDRAYGGASEVAMTLGLARPFLHAWKLSFPHPEGGLPIEVTDELPGDLRAVLERVGVPLPAA